MKYGIVISVSKTGFGPIVFKENLEENIIKTKEIGFNGIELAIKNTEELDINLLLNLVEKNDLRVATIGTGQIYVDDGLSLSDPDYEIRKETVNRIKKIIDIAKNFNTSVIIGCIRGKIKNDSEFPEEYEIAKKRILECLIDCMEYSQEHNTEFLLEPLNRYETNILNSVKDAVSFIEKHHKELDVDRIGVLADTFHMNIEDRNIHESLNENIESIKHIHFADSNRLPPGYGHINFSNIMNVLEDKDYNNYISFEMLPYPSPDIAAKKGLSYIKTLSKQIIMNKKNNTKIY